MFIHWVKNYNRFEKYNIPLVEGFDLKLKKTRYQSTTFFENVRRAARSDYRKSTIRLSNVDFNLHINLKMLNQSSESIFLDA